MAAFSALSVSMILVLFMVVPSLATVYTVGETNGWAIGVDYSTWTSDKTFAVGDTLVFNYPSGHTVDEVSESDYKTCTVGKAITTDSSGATTIPLKTAGSHYFICGILGHCGSGMKLAVTVAAAGSPTSPSGTPSSASPTRNNNTTTTVNTPPSTNVPESSSAATLSPLVALFVTWFALCVLVLS